MEKLTQTIIVDGKEIEIRVKGTGDKYIGKKFKYKNGELEIFSQNKSEGAVARTYLARALTAIDDVPRIGRVEAGDVWVMSYGPVKALEPLD